MERVSVVVPTYNRKKLLEKCFDSLFKQSYRGKYEIIVVDDGSSDGTRNLVKRLQKRHKNLRYFWQENKGPAAARNLGIKKSKGKIIAFTDDDCVADKDWLRNIVKYHRKYPRIKIVSGIYINQCKRNKYAELWDYFYKQGLKNSNLEKYRNGGGYIIKFKQRNMFCVGGNISYKTDVFKKIGLFDEQFKYAAFEDTDMALRSYKGGFDVFFSPYVKVNHYLRTNLIQFLKQCFVLGRGAYHMKLKSKGEMSHTPIKTNKSILLDLKYVLSSFKMGFGIFPKFGIIKGAPFFPLHLLQNLFFNLGGVYEKYKKS